MGMNDMTDTVNLRMLACELRKRQHLEVPDDGVLRDLSRKLGLSAWFESFLAKDSATLTAMLAFHMMDAGPCS